MILLLLGFLRFLDLVIDMAENNNSYWTKWLAGTLWVVVWGTILLIGNNVIANDKASRERDDILEANLNKCVMEQTQVNQEIMIQLAKISTDIDYIKKAVK